MRVFRLCYQSFLDCDRKLILAAHIR
jgi:hypothetical protein